MSADSTQHALNKAIYNPLLQQTKKTDLEQTISGFPSSKRPAPNQITIAMDKFENKLIKRRIFKP